MEHGASVFVKEESHMVMTVKAEVDKAAQCTAYHGVQTNANITEEEPGLVELVKSEPALFVKEGVVGDGWQDIAEQQCMQGPSTSAIVGSTNVLGSIGDRDNILSVKEELGAIDIPPTVLQHVDTWYTTNQKDMIVVKQERAVYHDKIAAILCGRVKEEIIEDACRGSPTPQDSLMEQPGVCTALHSLRKECLETVCRVRLRRVDTFQCQICDAVYINAHNLRQHVQDVHGPGLRGSPHRHVKSPQICKEGQQCATVSSPAVHTCDYCHKTYASNQALVHHIDVVHTKVSYRCSECNKEFKGKHLLQRHMKRLHSQEQHEADTDTQRSNEASQSKQRAQSQLYSCDKCVKTYTSKTSLLAHYRNRYSTESHKCTRCDKIFASKAYLYKHTSNAHSEQEHECAVCKKICTSKAALYTHVYRAHRPRPAGSKAHIYTCDYCKKMFTNKRNVQSHIARVHLSGSYKCHQCDKIFKCKEYLMRHKTAVHPAESHQLHTCSNCGKNFNLKQYCQRHEKRGKCARPTAGNTSAAASTSRQQRNVVIVKEEPADGELELGPTVFQHMDCNYRPYKPEPQLD